MRRWTFSVGMGSALVACLAIGVTGSADAATLDFTGSLELAFFSRSYSVKTGGAGAATVSVSGANHLAFLALPAGAFGPITTSLPGTSLGGDTNSLIFTAIQNLAGSFPEISGGPPGGGTMGLSGTVKICLVFAPCQFAQVPFPLTPSPGGAGFGIGGTVAIPGAVPVTMQHAAWTLGQPVMTFHNPYSSVTTRVFPGGFAHGPASLTSSTAQPSGALQLVTVTKVVTSIYEELPLFAIMNLHFVPEPGTLLLLGLGVVGLAAVGRLRSLH